MISDYIMSHSKNDISKIKVSISELAEQAMDLAGDNSAEEVSPDLGLE